MYGNEDQLYGNEDQRIETWRKRYARRFSCLAFRAAAKKRLQPRLPFQRSVRPPAEPAYGGGLRPALDIRAVHLPQIHRATAALAQSVRCAFIIPQAAKVVTFSALLDKQTNFKRLMGNLTKIY